jgi:plastocyanin
MKGIFWLCLGPLVLTGCSGPGTKAEHKVPEGVQKPAYYTVNPVTAGVISGVVRFSGRKPRLKPIDMSSDPACVEAHHGQPYDESLVVGEKGVLANVFVYVKTGLEGKTFETPAQPATIDQRGCWFRPRVLGIQVGQTLKVANSDPVTHNIHPLAQINREWNHSQGAGDPPISRRFLKPEIMIPVKCNIHSWMHAYIGVLDHPYFSVSGTDGTFEIRNVPPGDYVIEAWQEKLGSQRQTITITQSGRVETAFTFKGE